MIDTKKSGAIWGKGGYVHAEYRNGVFCASMAFFDAIDSPSEAGQEIRLLLQVLKPGDVSIKNDLPRVMVFLN